MKKNVLSRAGLSLLGLLIFTSSCKQDSDIASPSDSVTVRLSEKEKEELMNDFSHGLAQALQQEPSLRRYLKNESAKQIDGDYDVFYLASKGDKVDENNTLHDLLVKYSSPTSVKKIDNDFLNLNIKVLGFDTSVENWNTQDFTPIVAVRGYDKNNSSITAYNGKGEKLLLDSHKQPQQLTVVIEESERIHINSYETLVKDWNNSIRQIIPYKVESNSILSSVQKGTNSLVTTLSFRDPPAWWTGPCPRRSTEGATQPRNVLDRFTITRSAFEKASDNWTEGRLDINAKLLTVRGDSKALDELNVYTEVYKETKFPVTDRYGTIKGYTTVYGYDTSQNFGADLGIWDPTLNGNTWKLSFLESDPGDATTTITRSFTSTYDYGIKTTDANKNVIGFNASYQGAETGSYSTVIKNVDDPLGDQFIYYCDPLGSSKIYNTGDLSFSIVPSY